MPAFTLYGFHGSTNTDRVRLTLAEGGFTDYELVTLNLQKGEQKVLVNFSLPPTPLIHQIFVLTYTLPTATHNPITGT